MSSKNFKVERNGLVFIASGNCLVVTSLEGALEDVLYWTIKRPENQADMDEEVNLYLGLFNS